MVHVETPLAEAWPRMTPGKGKEAYDDRAEGKRRIARRPNAKAFGVEGLLVSRPNAHNRDRALHRQGECKKDVNDDD